MSERNTVWIIVGSNGQYSDHAQWIVCWCASEADCAPVLALCLEQAAEIERLHRLIYSMDPTNDDSECNASEDRRNAFRLQMFDASFRGNGYDETSYRAVEIFEDPREFERFNAMMVGAA